MNTHTINLLPEILNSTLGSKFMYSYADAQNCNKNCEILKCHCIYSQTNHIQRELSTFRKYNSFVVMVYNV